MQEGVDAIWVKGRTEIECTPLACDVGRNLGRTQSPRLSLSLTWTGCLSASNTEMREVSLTRDGFPNRASIYRPATAVAFLAE
jgi:hypothetical protein